MVHAHTAQPQWSLVCDRSAWRTATQTGVSLGKAVGALAAGILSDKYGRRSLYVAGAVLYVAASVLMWMTPWYGGFLAGRLAIGVASSMIFYPTAVLGE